MRWYAHELKELNVEVRLNTKMTAEDIQKEEFDVLILATGSIPKLIPLEGNVLTAEDVLLARPIRQVHCDRRRRPGWLRNRPLLREQGKDVTIVEAMDKLLAVNGPLCHANSEMLEALVPFRACRSSAALQ